LSSRADDQDQFVVSGTQTGHLPELSNEHFAQVTGIDINEEIVMSEGKTDASSESMAHATW
jgi:L-ribulose-5-phosphate 4-epimerase